MFEKFNQYLLMEKRYSDHTLSAYQLDIDQFFEFFGSVPADLAEIRSSHIRSWIVELFERNVSRKSINRKLSSLRTFFKWLKKEGLIQLNPILKINGPKNEKRLPQFAKESELLPEKINSIFTNDFDGCRDRVLFEIFYQTGIRLSELINLKETDVDISKIKVLGKRNKERIIPISDDLRKLILEYRVFKKNAELNSVWFFVLNNGNKLYSKFVYRKINGYLGSVTSLDKKSPHVLRHTFATHMLNNGAGLETLKDLLGHANLSATQVYTHNSFTQLKSIYSQAHPRGHKN